MTEIIARGRASGKTTHSLHRLAINPKAVYVAPNHQMADQAFRTAKGLGLDIDRSRFISAPQALADRAGADTDPREYVLDNAELILSAIFGRVDTMTLSLKIEAV